MGKKILIVDSGDTDLSTALVHAIMNKSNTDAEIIQSEDLSKKVSIGYFEKPTIVIKPYEEPIEYINIKSGRENRRERRAKKRKNK